MIFSDKENLHLSLRLYKIWLNDIFFMSSLLLRKGMSFLQLSHPQSSCGFKNGVKVMKLIQLWLVSVKYSSKIAMNLQTGSRDIVISRKCYILSLLVTLNMGQGHQNSTSPLACLHYPPHTGYPQTTNSKENTHWLKKNVQAKKISTLKGLF